MVKKNLTIFFVTNNYRPYSAGVVSAIDATVQQLRKLGHRVLIITLDFGYECSIDEHNLFHVPCQIKFSFRSYPLAVPFFPSRSLRKLVEQFRPDIIHVHHPFLLGKCAANIGVNSKIPVVLTLHMLYEKHVHNHMPFFPQVIRNIAQEKLRQFCKNVCHIIAPSSSVKRYLEEQNIQNTISIIPSGILPIFQTEDLSKKTNNIVELLHVGRFVPEKNIDWLLDAFSMLPQEGFRLTIAGFGTEYSYLRSHAYQVLKLSSQNVRFIYQPPKKMIVELYKKADLFLFSSLYETQGMVLAESMASGTPVVAFRGFAIDDIVKNGENGLLVDTKTEMAQAIVQISQDRNLLRNLSHGAYHTAKNYYPEVVVNKLLSLYYNLLSN